MTKYREILRLHSQGVSQRGIASSCRCSRNTVSKVLERVSLTDRCKIAVTEIHTNRLDYAKNTNNRDPVEKEGVTIHKVKEKQRHQGNAILDITRDCIQHISSYLNKNLIKFSKAIYRTSDNKTAVVCLTSRGIDKGESTKYWFGFRIVTAQPKK